MGATAKYINYLLFSVDSWWVTGGKHACVPWLAKPHLWMWNTQASVHVR